MRGSPIKVLLMQFKLCICGRSSNESLSHGAPWDSPLRQTHTYHTHTHTTHTHTQRPGPTHMQHHTGLKMGPTLML